VSAGVPEFTARLEGLNLRRGGRWILRDIHWTVAASQRWVVLGPNGAGKTQLLKLLSGAVWPDPVGRGVAGVGPASRQYASEGEWSPTPPTQHILYLGPELQDKYQHYGWNFRVSTLIGTGIARTDIPLRPLLRQERARVRAALEALGILSLARRAFLSLSYGERRMVLLARAIAAQGKLLLLDELLGGMDAEHRARVSAWLNQPNSQQGWVLSSHRVEEIPAAATHLLRLDAGRIVAAGPIRGVDRRIARRRNPTQRPAILAPVLRPRETLLQLHDVSLYVDYRRVLRDLSWTVCAGDAWVVEGRNGSGKTTLLRALWGDLPAALGGRIERTGIAPGMPLEVFRAWCAWVAPGLQVLLPRRDRVLDVVVSGLRASVGLAEPATAAEQRQARRALRVFGSSDLAERTLGELSYGQGRRVLFARAWVRAPRLLLLDEPFGGVDAATRADLLQRLQALRARGVAVVLSTHHRDERPAALTGILCLSGGRGRVYPRSAQRNGAPYGPRRARSDCPA